MFARRSAVSFLVGLFVAVTAAAVFAANPHFKGGQPTCTADGLTITCTGQLAGLGNEDVQITTSGSATFETTCRNRGGSEAPGQNPAVAQFADSTIIPADEVDNGTLSFTVTTTITAPTPTAQEAGCPNGNWTAVVGDATGFSAVSFSVFQPAGTLVLGPVNLQVQE
jgi:hypothetical protein